MGKHYCTVLLLLISSLIWSQRKPKVGLVLSGGGAKGMAHIGALKVIEEAGIKIDYVGGTSMGAIIGGLYAAGYTANELDSIFKTTNLSQLITDNLPRNAKTFYEKDDAERYALSLPFDNFKVSFPEAISGGQNIYNEFIRLLYHVKDVEDFNELPIPFICIATNIETGKPVLMNKGYLPEAIMASGTLPSLFEPSEIDGQILIDGGVVNNYPINEVRKKGADIIIGIDVQDDLAKRESLSSATEILFQINNYRTVNEMNTKREETDVYIKPNIAKYTVIDFEETENIIAEGVKAAELKLQDLKDVARLQGANKRKSIEKAKDSLTINRLIIKGNERYTRGYIKGKLRFTLGNTITFKRLQQGLGNMAATGNFKAIRYKLVSNGLGTDLILNLKENPTKMFIKMGAHYDDLYKSAALINLTRKNLIFKDDVGSFDFILGDHIRYNFQYYIDKGFYWSFGINSKFNTFDEAVDFKIIQENFNISGGENLSEINLDFSDLTNQIYLQTVVREEFAFRTGLEHRFIRFSTTTFNNLPLVDENESLENKDGRIFFENSNYFSGFANLRLDTYDDKYFPTRGLYFNGNLNYYVYNPDLKGDFQDFAIAKAQMGVALPITHNLSINLDSEGGFKLGTSRIATFDFIMGGFGNHRVHNLIPFMGYDFLSLTGNSFVKAKANLDFEFARKNHLLLQANMANIDDDLFRTGEWFTAPDYTGFGIGYGLESFLGPVQVYYSWTPQRNDSHLFFSVGFWF